MSGLFGRILSVVGRPSHLITMHQNHQIGPVQYSKESLLENGYSVWRLVRVLMVSGG